MCVLNLTGLAYG